MKTCVKCGTEKNHSEFHKDNLRKDGLFPYCKQCRNVKRKPKKKIYRRVHSRGYILLNIPDHPLAQSNGYIYEHRLVFHAYFSNSILKCGLCGADWRWRTYKDHIDHIDEDKANNQISNLRPLCNSCNVTRTKKTQCDAKGRTRIEYDGKALTAEEWSRDPLVDVTGFAIRNRLKNGWSIYDSLFKKSRKSK